MELKTLAERDAAEQEARRLFEKGFTLGDAHHVRCVELIEAVRVYDQKDHTRIPDMVLMMINGVLPPGWNYALILTPPPVGDAPVPGFVTSNMEHGCLPHIFRTTADQMESGALPPPVMAS